MLVELYRTADSRGVTRHLHRNRTVNALWDRDLVSIHVVSTSHFIRLTDEGLAYAASITDWCPECQAANRDRLGECRARWHNDRNIDRRVTRP